MDKDYKRLIEEIEADLGRPMDTSEVNAAKALWYFCKGVEIREAEQEKLAG